MSASIRVPEAVPSVTQGSVPLTLSLAANNDVSIQHARLKYPRRRAIPRIHTGQQLRSSRGAVRPPQPSTVTPSSADQGKTRQLRKHERYRITILDGCSDIA